MNLEKINSNKKILKISSIATSITIFLDFFVYCYLSDVAAEAQRNVPCSGLACAAKAIGEAGAGLASLVALLVIIINFMLSIGNAVLIFADKRNKLVSPLIITIAMAITTALSFLMNSDVYDILSLVPVILIIITLVYIIKTRTIAKMDKTNNMQVTQHVSYQDNVVQSMAMPNQVVNQPAVQPMSQVVEQQPVVQSQPQQVQVLEVQPQPTQSVQSQVINTMIDLNNLTPEQKDQLLTVLLKNNQKTNE